MSFVSPFFSENLAADCFQGCFVVTCTLCAFISLVWLREQILHGGGPDWLEQEDQGANQARVFNLILHIVGYVFTSREHFVFEI